MHWCLTHRTALAEAEVEYADHTSPSIYVRFPVVGDLGKADPRLRGPAGGVRHLDHDPLDAARQPGRGRQPRARLRRHPGTPTATIPVVAGGLAEAFLGRDRHRRAARVAGSGISARRVCRALEGTRYTPPVPAGRTGAASGTTACASRATRRWRPAPAWCTPRPATAPRTTSSDATTGCASTRPSTRAAASPPTSRAWAGTAGVRGQPEDRRRCWPSAASCSTSRARRSATVPALLALQEAGHLPRHRAVVRPPRRGGRPGIAAPAGAGRDRTHAAGSRPGARTASAA